jgi:hypothetical protein
MFSFFNKRTGRTIVPEWASFFDDKEYSVFIEEINNFFEKLNIQYKISDGQVIVDDNDFSFRNLGLVNVAQVCKQEEPKLYKQIIDAHFNSLIRASQFTKEFDVIADNFDEVKKYIGVRLYDNENFATIGKGNTIGKDFAGNIYAMVVFDFPDSVTSIKPEQTTAWNKTNDELFEIGLENVRKNYPVTITKEAIGEFSIWLVQGDHFFTANIVYDIEKRQELVGGKGSLIGLPHRHSAIIYAIENLEVIKAINGLIPLIFGMNQEGPGSLSNNLFWYHDRTFTELPYNIDDNKLEFFPPDNFLEMLNGL